MTKKILILLSFSIIILGIILIYKNYKEELKIKCTNSSNLSYILVCMERGHLYNQEQYDAYYNIAANNPPLSIIQDDIFYQGFSLAYRNCGIDSRPSSCNRKDEKVMEDFIIKCTENAQKRSFCTDYYFENSNPNKKNIKYFVNIVQQQIKENIKYQYDLKKFSCGNQYKSFYDKINLDLIDLVPLEVKEVCKSTN